MDGTDHSFWSSDTIWFYVSLGLGAILIFQAGLWFGRYTSTATTSTTPKTAQAQSGDDTVSEPDDSKEPDDTNNAASLPDLPRWLQSVQTHSGKKALGNPGAPLTVTEYLDFECPFCRRYSQETFPKILENYIQTGKVYYKVKHYPLPMHDNAVPAGNAAECASDQDKFWAYKHVVMNSDRSLTEKNLISTGRHIGVDNIKQYTECVLSLTHESIVNNEQSDGDKRGVSATPTVFVGDTKIEGAQPYAKFKQAIEDALSS